ncbi:hypothetical protein GBA65_20735 [Rubrobacter marinus]|uniref:Sulfotransferase domain-containing protein n=1 Tax=Rubrobacter marinus TaxID=2653852 RepID=A0A6G8Q245_9ACTN|nr:sulfotransferase [Rubrobacter marinus]QIN80533.1 hypothetical protein GBA65_20735 [Rubrobacter marinus]
MEQGSARTTAGVVREQGRLVLACGGYRSGSTLQYNLIGEYVERVNGGRRIGLLDPPEAARLWRGLWGIVGAMGLAVAKSHHAVGGFQDFGGAERVWSELAERGLIAPVYSVRDWRDVAYSMSRKFGRPLAELFESSQWRENLAHMEVWLALGALVQRYEDLVGDAAGSLEDMSHGLGLPWAPEAAGEAAEAAGLAAQRAVTGRLAAGGTDPRHLVHWDHIADPGGGAWRVAWDEEERELAREELAPLMERFGYEWD